MILLNKTRKDYSHRHKKNDKTPSNTHFKIGEKENNALAANLATNHEDSIEVSINN